MRAAETSLPGFGKFKVEDSSAREGRHSSIGATVAIAASRKRTFAAAKTIKDGLNPGEDRNGGAS
ncbi:nucleoid DNA-binding protein [Bradyrhizobium sp. LB7.2]